jgi:hypothetical protein
LECGDSSPLSFLLPLFFVSVQGEARLAGASKNRRKESGDESPHSKKDKSRTQS